MPPMPKSTRSSCGGCSPVIDGIHPVPMRMASISRALAASASPEPSPRGTRVRPGGLYLPSNNDGGAPGSTSATQPTSPKATTTASRSLLERDAKLLRQLTQVLREERCPLCHRGKNSTLLGPWHCEQIVLKMLVSSSRARGGICGAAGHGVTPAVPRASRSDSISATPQSGSSETSSASQRASMSTMRWARSARLPQRSCSRGAWTSQSVVSLGTRLPVGESR